jgi:hypothetical protein
MTSTSHSRPPNGNRKHNHNRPIRDDRRRHSSLSLDSKTTMTVATVLLWTTTSITTSAFILPTTPITSHLSPLHNKYHREWSAKPSLMIIDEWSISPDGRLQGIILPQGDQITTSPLVQNTRLARTNNKKNGIVQTTSGSKYQLGTPAVNQAADKSSTTTTAIGAKTRLDPASVVAATAVATSPLPSKKARNDSTLQEFLANKKKNRNQKLQNQSNQSSVTTKGGGNVLTVRTGYIFMYI